MAADWLPFFFIRKEVFILPKIRLKVSMAGSDHSYVPGDILDVRKDVADAWIGADIAELVEEPKATKKASLKKGDVE